MNPIRRFQDWRLVIRLPAKAVSLEGCMARCQLRKSPRPGAPLAATIATSIPVPANLEIICDLTKEQTGQLEAGRYWIDCLLDRPDGFTEPALTPYPIEVANSVTLPLS
ncbi:hypothetical protein JIN85_19255 [Luteolibacter pohnpeiensis]|uniref:Uncharacterized protein n=1 Tax=Luteolibacter pohnpeiensis TaxID=454153 RepID=A0A934SEB9_9BACT|nr:hypothetical protein [Luteolibacter pohnpeiensis]MBK1884562.1 hypothetical protein [Luteolibacter pohnpeiensis]